MTQQQQDLERISQARLDEAKALISAGLYDGAMYLAGYAVETSLKAVICKKLGTDWPPSQTVFIPETADKWPLSVAEAMVKAHRTHRLDDLILLAGLKVEFDQKKQDQATNFGRNWSEVSLWKETRRYDAIGTGNITDANNLITALEDSADGILTWLKTKW